MAPLRLVVLLLVATAACGLRAFHGGRRGGFNRGGHGAGGAIAGLVGSFIGGVSQRHNGNFGGPVHHNGGFRHNGGLHNGGFQNSGFRHNGGLQNGGFRHNGGLQNGGFHNGGFQNGGFRHNGGFQNGGFHNGGLQNGGFIHGPSGHSNGDFATGTANSGVTSALNTGPHGQTAIDSITANAGGETRGNGVSLNSARATKIQVQGPLDTGFTIIDTDTTSNQFGR